MVVVKRHKNASEAHTQWFLSAAEKEFLWDNNKISSVSVHYGHFSHFLKMFLSLVRRRWCSCLASLNTWATHTFTRHSGSIFRPCDLLGVEGSLPPSVSCFSKCVFTSHTRLFKRSLAGSTYEKVLQLQWNIRHSSQVDPHQDLKIVSLQVLEQIVLTSVQ